MSASSPQISRPSGPSPNIAVWNRIWQYSEGSSRYERISSMMTVRSLSMSASLEPRSDDQLADDVHRAFSLATWDSHPVDSRFAIGGGVERAADALDRLADGAGRGIRGRALERQVLHEMCDPDLTGGLES